MYFFADSVTALNWKAMGPALTAVVVPIVLGWLLKSAQSESRANVGVRVIAYPIALKILTIVMWFVFAGLVVLVATSARDANLANMSAFAAFFIALNLPLHLEAFGMRITWDDEFIYTRSPWRRARKIPVSAIRSCDYSTVLQYYRVYTEGFGIIRLQLYAKGVPELLKILPCPHPSYPPAVAPYS